MKPTVPLMMWGWIPFVMQLFQKISHRRAVIASVILAWMFLPEYSYILPVLPEYNKKTATTLAVLIATFLYSKHRMENLQFDVFDSIMIIWCLTPMFASISNGLGVYDGVVACKNYVTIWMIPYYVGRMYMTNWDAISDLAWGVFFGGLIYGPLCWAEMILSPQLHMWVYGWHPHDFIQSVRGNSYRPVLFMHHGLMVGMWMASACLCGITLLTTKQINRVKPLMKKVKIPPFVKPWMVVATLIFTFVCCRSMGAIVLFLQAVGAIYVSKRFKTRLILLALLIYPAYKMGGSITGLVDGHKGVAMARKIFGEERALSLECRVLNEEMLVDKAMIRPVFGWGGWGRSRVRDETGKDISIVDAYWVIILGSTGVVGVASFMLVVCGPAWRLVWKFPKEGWSSPQAMLAMPLAVLLPMYAQDCLLNDMKNPMFMVIAGGLISLTSVPGLLKVPTAEGEKLETIKNPGLAGIPGLTTRYV